MHSPSLRSSTLQHGKPRRQDRNTPRRLIDRALVCANVERFCLDPATNPRSLVNARHECYYGGAGRRPRPLQEPQIRALSRAAPGDVYQPRWLYRGDGLLLPWEEHFHVWGNPPWNNAGAFVQRAAEAAIAMRARGGAWSIQMLVPLRTHRAWWDWACTANAWCLLKPVAFEGFPNAIPTPCAILYWGPDVAAFRQAWCDEGIVLTRIPRPGTLGPMPLQSWDNKLNKHSDSELMIDGYCRLLDALVPRVSAEVLAEAMTFAFTDWTPAELARFVYSDPGSMHQMDYTDVKAAKLYEIVGIQDCPELRRGVELMLSTMSIKQALASAKPVKGAESRATVGSAKKRSKKKTSKSALRKAAEGKGTSSAPKKASAKKAPKKVATKKAPKKASAKKAPKKASPKKAPKKASAKKAPKKTSGTIGPLGRGKKAGKLLRLGDGIGAVDGMRVILLDDPAVIGTIGSIDDSAKSLVVNWDSGAPTKVQAVAIASIGGPLAAKPAKGKGAKAANDAPVGAGDPAQLDDAIATQLLPGRGKTGFKCKDVATAFHVSESTALRSIRRLEKAGKVSSKGAGRAKEYFSKVA